MTPLDFVTGGLILLGAGVMLLSVLGTVQVLRMVRASRFFGHWRALGLLMVFFLAGYLAAIVLLLVGLKDILAVITGAIFLFGALFVYLVVGVGRATIQELQDRAQELQVQQEELQAARDDELQLEEKVLAAQRVATEFSTPVIPIAAGVLVMPLMGTIDVERARLITRTLLKQVRQLRARVAIIDITGVALVDTMVVRALLDAALGVRLLGAEALLTGIRAETAQTIVGAGLDMTRLIIRATLAEGLVYALGSSGKAANPTPSGTR
jgi:anti-anti-sigma regulatory factor